MVPSSRMSGEAVAVNAVVPLFVLATLFGVVLAAALRWVLGRCDPLVRRWAARHYEMSEADIDRLLDELDRDPFFGRDYARPKKPKRGE